MKATKNKEKLMATFEVGDKGTWEGVIKSVLYIGDNNYAVIKMIFKNNKEIIAEGKIPNPQKNAYIKVTGSIVYNSTYKNNQIKVTSCNIKVSPEIMSAISFIYSDAIPGFSTTKVASEFVEHFGPNLSSYMTDINKLMSYPRITEKKAKLIKESYEKNEVLYPLFQVTNGKITYKQAIKIYDKYKDQAADEIKKNPYQLIYDIEGIGFASADDLALHMGFKYDSRERISAAIIYTVKNAELTNGHIYLPTKQVLEETEDLIFSLKELKNVYYQDALLMKGIPDDLTDWEETSLYELVKASKTKTSVLNKIINTWGENETRDENCKKYNFTTEEIDTIDSFYIKRQNFMSVIEEILNKTAFDAKKLSAKEIIYEISKIENRRYPLIKTKGRCNEDAIYLTSNFRNEYEIARILGDNLKQGVIRTISDKLIDGAISIIEKNEGMKINAPYILDDTQRKAVYTALKNRISVITGGPGCGKTTIIKTAIAGWNASSPRDNKSNNKAKFILLAPTGRAAKRMSESTGYPALTIHRFLLHNGVNFNSDYTNNNIDCIKNDDTIIFVDETSMLDIALAKKLITCTKRAQICFVGDIDQLPSVGAGTFLEDLINSNKIPYVYLTNCHRNSGSILNNSKKINAGGQLRELENDIHFKTLWLNDIDVIKKNVLNIYSNLRKQFKPEEIIILTPMRSSSTGIDILNTNIQSRINPPAINKKEITIGKGKTTTFRAGDRVMQAVNNYKKEVKRNGVEELGIFNGDLGTIRDFYKDENDEIYGIIDFDDGAEAKYYISDFKELELAYALTYHKSQGSEFKAVICVLTTGDFMLLKRKILYTGISRAKELCVCVGMPKAFNMAIKDYGGDHTKRNTTLNKRLNEYL